MNFDHGTNLHLRAGPLPVSCHSNCQRCIPEILSKSDDSGCADDPRQSVSVPNSLSQLQHAYDSGSESVVACTPEKKFDDLDGLSDCSDLHMPAQPCKRRHLPSPSPVKRRHVAGSESDSEGVDRDSLFDFTPTHKRGFKRPRQAWSLVKEWKLEEYDREVEYEEIARNPRRALLLLVHLRIDADAMSNFVFLRPRSLSGWKLRVSILPRVMFKTRFQSF